MHLPSCAKADTEAPSGVVDPSPACRRALDMAVSALERQGHVTAKVSPPSPFRGLRLGAALVSADGATTFHADRRTGERTDPGAAQMARWAALPRLLRRLYVWYVRHVRRAALWADLLEAFGLKSTADFWRWTAARNAYRDEWHAWWAAEAWDCVLTVPHATPAVPHGGMREAVSSCGYTFLFNVVRAPSLFLNPWSIRDRRLCDPPGVGCGAAAAVRRTSC